jgi:hypothetical protein
VTLPAWATVATVVSDAAIELGLASADISDPYASTDPNVLQLVRLLKSGGRELLRMRDWSHLVKEYTFPTVASTASYALPSDFRKMIPQSGWDRSTLLPMSGPVSSQVWQYRAAVTVTASILVEFRLWQGLMYLTPTPTSAETIAYEYLSTYWVATASNTLPTLDAPSASTDVICFEPNLVVRKLKLDFRKAKGFDTSAALMDFESSLQSALGADATAPVLSLNGSEGVPLIDVDNVPDTGYG